MRSVYFKNFILVSSLFMISFIILGSVFIIFGRNYMLSDRRGNIEQNAQELSRLASAYARDGDLEDWNLRISLSAISKSSGYHCFVCDAGGTVVSCSDMDFNCSHLGVKMPENLLSGIGSGKNYISSLGGFYPAVYFVSAQPVSGLQGQVLGYAFVSASNTNLLAVWESILSIFFVSSIAMLIIALIMCIIITRRQSMPINAMAKAAVKFSHGDFSTRVEFDRYDEVGALAAAFNQMADSLEKSERQRNEFVANVSHELKTPMTTISGFADGILDGTIPPENQKKYLETISSETKRLNRLVRRMLDLSRMQQLSREELLSHSFDVGETLLRTLLNFEGKINEKLLDVAPMLPETPIIARGDSDTITQVMYNLLENAIKFARPGSRLGAELFKQGSKAYVSIKNEGLTIPPEELPHIFDRFHKADKSRSMDREGWGLGLYIAKTIINSHGEDIVVKSSGNVTEFIFSLTIKEGK